LQHGPVAKRLWNVPQVALQCSAVRQSNFGKFVKEHLLENSPKHLLGSSPKQLLAVRQVILHFQAMSVTQASNAV
jgi:hypothetical protein